MKRCASTPTKTPLHHHLAAHNFKPADLLQVHAVDSKQNKVMNVDSGERQSAGIEQLQKAVDASPGIADKLSGLVREKLEDATS